MRARHLLLPVAGLLAAAALGALSGDVFAPAPPRPRAVSPSAGPVPTAEDPAAAEEAGSEDRWLDPEEILRWLDPRIPEAERLAAIPELRGLLAGPDVAARGLAAGVLLFLAPETGGLLPPLLALRQGDRWDEFPIGVDDLRAAWPDLPERLASLVADPEVAADALDLLLDLDPPPMEALEAVRAVGEDAPFRVWLRALTLRATLAPGEVDAATLAAVFECGDDRISRKVLAALERLGPLSREVEEDLLRFARYEGPGTRFALIALGLLGDPNAVAPALRETFETLRVEENRLELVRVLARRGDPVREVVDSLVAEWAGADRGSPARRRSALAALEAVGPAAAPAVPVLASALREARRGDPLWLELVIALGAMGPAGTEALVEAAGGAADVRVREAAAGQLPQCDAAALRSVEGRLRELLASPDPEFRVPALEALLHAGCADPPVLEALAAALAVEDHMWLAGRMAEAAEGAGPACIPVLSAAAEKAPAGRRAMLLLSVRRLCGAAPGLAAAIVEWLSENLEHCADSWLEELSGADAAAVAPVIARGLRHADWCARAGAAHTLGLYGEAAAVVGPELTNALDDPHPDVRRAVRAALRRIR